ncbi:hypothetical protein D3C87_1601370 [compost metagenome]
MHFPFHRHRRFLIQTRASPRQHLFQQGAPLDAAAPFFRHLAVINIPAVFALQRSMARCLLRVIDHLLGGLSAAVRHDANVQECFTIDKRR